MPLLLFLFVAVILLGRRDSAPGSVTITDADRRSFVRLWLPIAMEINDRFKIPPTVSVPKWAHETGYGTGTIYRNTFNVGSITAESWAFKDAAGQWKPRAGYAGRIFVNETIEYVRKPEPGDKPTGKHRGELVEVVRRRPFRKYATPLEGAVAWAQMLANSTLYPERYAAAKTGNLATFAVALQKTNYATDPDYAEKIVRNVGNALNYA